MPSTYWRTRLAFPMMQFCLMLTTMAGFWRACLPAEKAFERNYIDTTAGGKLAGIEILKASNKLDINTILSYTLELDHGILKQNVAEQGTAP